MAAFGRFPSDDDDVKSTAISTSSLVSESGTRDQASRNTQLAPAVLDRDIAAPGRD